MKEKSSIVVKKLSYSPRFLTNYIRPV